MVLKNSQLSRKLDALYIRHHFPIALVVYFSLCFSILRILRDLTGTSSSMIETYGIPVAFTAIVGGFLRRWANRTVKEMGLEDIS